MVDQSFHQSTFDQRKIICFFIYIFSIAVMSCCFRARVTIINIASHFKSLNEFDVKFKSVFYCCCFFVVVVVVFLFVCFQWWQEIFTEEVKKNQKIFVKINMVRKIIQELFISVEIVLQQSISLRFKLDT